MHGTLSVRVQFDPGDCLTYANAYLAHALATSRQMMAKHLGLPMSVCHSPLKLNNIGASAVQRVANNLRIPGSHVFLETPVITLARHSAVPSGAPLGEFPDRKIVHRKATPVCAECVTERPWAVRSEWRICLVPICLRHRRLLIVKCVNPRCGQALRNALGPITTQPNCPHCQHPIPISKDNVVPSGSPLITAVNTLLDAVTRSIAVSSQTTLFPDFFSIALLASHLGATRSSRLTGVVPAPEVMKDELPPMVRLLSAPPRNADIRDLLWLSAKTQAISHFDVQGKPMASTVLQSAILHAHHQAERKNRRPHKSRLAASKNFRKVPQVLIPHAVMTLEISDLLHDLWMHALGDAPEWQQARAVVSILCVAVLHPQGIDEGVLNHPDPWNVHNIAIAIVRAAQELDQWDPFVLALHHIRVLSRHATQEEPPPDALPVRGANPPKCETLRNADPASLIPPGSTTDPNESAKQCSSEGGQVA